MQNIAKQCNIVNRVCEWKTLPNSNIFSSFATFERQSASTRTGNGEREGEKPPKPVFSFVISCLTTICLWVSLFSSPRNVFCSAKTRNSWFAVLPCEHSNAKTMYAWQIQHFTLITRKEKSFFSRFYVKLQLAFFQRGRVVSAFFGFAARPSRSSDCAVCWLPHHFHSPCTSRSVTSATNESFVDFLPIVSCIRDSACLVCAWDCRTKRLYLRVYASNVENVQKSIGIMPGKALGVGYVILSGTYATVATTRHYIADWRNVKVSKLFAHG